ncbi:MAG TPA: hypothetical protein DCP11_03305 [Microbacteriaceae bacterium]|nr:hypothetical protein [Microbacteriaceae bacterium]
MGDGIIIVEDSSVAGSRSSRGRPGDASFAAVREVLQLQSRSPALSRFSRLFGVDPVTKHAAGWYRAAAAEVSISVMLADLGEDWTILRSVATAPDRPRLDYVLVGPPGIIAVTLAHHVGQRVWVGERTFLAEDDLLPRIADSERDADSVAERMAAAGCPSPVTPCIVVVEPAGLEIRKRPRDAEVVHSRNFAGWLADLPRLLAPSAVGLLASAAQDPDNWPDIPGQPADTADRLREFESLRRSVERARRRRLSWIVVGIALSYGLLFVRSGVLAAFGVHLAFPL